MNIETKIVALQGSPVRVGNAADAFAHDARRLIEGLDGRKATALFEVIAEQGHDRLTDGKAAAVEQEEHSLPRLFETKHLAGGVHLVESGVGARIRSEDQTIVRHNAQAIRH